MKNPFYEKTQKGNPHQLTKYQHIFPKKSIERFCDTGGVVEVCYNQKQKTLKLKPENKFFCVKRVWYQKAEITGTRTESKFQIVADKILKNQIVSLDEEMQRCITEMYLLWRARHIYGLNPLPDQAVYPSKKLNCLTPDEQESYERKGIHYLDDGTMSSRMITGIMLVQDVYMANDDVYEKMTWGIVRSPAGLEFLCPDVSITQPILPVSPNICFIGGWPNGTLTPIAVAEINRTLMDQSKNYWFARSLAKCPITSKIKSYIQSNLPSGLS